MARRVLFVLIVLIPISGFSQFWDTSLLTLYSRPFYYNVVKARDGKIYAGSSDGIFRLEETTPIKIDNRIGYLKIDSSGRVELNPNGIKYHHQTNFNHLLPYPTEKRDEYHTGTGNYFYITSSGRLHVFEIRPYSFRYRNHSVRSVSENFTGTYSGIYFKNKLLPKPISPFTDGFIREMNGKVFMCTNGLDVFSIEDIENGPPYRALNLPNNFDFIRCTDIQAIEKNKNYLLAANNSLALLDTGLNSVKELFKGNSGTSTVLWNEYRGEVFYFSSGNQVFAYDLSTQSVTPSYKLVETIMDGRVNLHNAYMLTENGLYRQKGEEAPEKLIKLNRAHTLLPINESEFIISTDEGLFLYRADENKLLTLIPGVEFNRRSLFLKDNKVYAGSISGLFVLDLSQIDQIIANANKSLNANNASGISPWILTIIAMGFVFLLSIILIYRMRIKRMQTVLDSGKVEEKKPQISREDIELFVRNNLPLASLKTINTHFSTNTSMVYTLLEPDKPGDLIQNLRYEKVKELRKEGKTAKEIALCTGLSDSYVRKIWNTLA
ncbi:MAG: hypothetical protein ACK5CL_06445 [Sphingomonadales bacterium]|jgi:hypothetical protein